MMFRRLSFTFAVLLLFVSPVLATTKHHHHHHARVHPAAKAHVAQSVTVWVNTNSGVYHYPGERWYGRTQEGEYMSENAAKAAGYRATENGQ